MPTSLADAAPLQGSPRLDGKVALISGGALGFGAAMARRFIAEGARCTIIDMNREAGMAMSKELGESLHFVEGNVTVQATWETALEETLRTFGGLHILVNNAGISRSAPAHELSESDFDALLGVNLKSNFFATKVVFPHFLQTGDGRVLNISSTGATRPRPTFAWYNMTKAAIYNLTKTLAVEYAPKIRVNAIVPAIGNTSMLKASFAGRDPTEEELAWIHSWIPMKRICEPEDVAEAATFLVSDSASFITGTCLDVDGGRGI
ncbi:hypothetical protein JCM10207_007173 [Rhodosporidiobolus poonsookiae]